LEPHGRQATMSDEYVVLRFHPLSDTEDARAQLQRAADEGFEWVEVIPSTDSALVIMKRPKPLSKDEMTTAETLKPFAN
jgi:hypothetical protein